MCIHDLDVQTIRRFFDADLVCKLGQLGTVGDDIDNFVAQLVEPFRFLLPVQRLRCLGTTQFFCAFAVAPVCLTIGLAQVPTSAREYGIAAPRAWPPHQGDLERRGEIVGNAFFVAFRGGTQQPHQQKESHHGRHKVGVGNLPGAAMRGVPALLHALDDDRL